MSKSAASEHGRRIRSTTLLIVAVVVVAACGRDSAAVTGGPSGSVSTTATSGVAGQSPTTARTGAGGSRPTPTTARSSTRSPSGAQPTTTRFAGQSASPTDPYAAARGPVGGFGPVVLRPQPAARVVVEPLVQQGQGPQSSTMDHLVRVLSAATGKSVAVASTVALPATGSTIGDDEIRSLADRNTKQPQGSGTAVIHVLFLAGSYREDSGVIGIADRGDVVAIFHEKVRSSATPIVRSSTIEDAVVEHETGHLLGLVDLVLHTGRQDPDHPGHSRNTGSVMYWAIDSDLVGQVLDGPPPVDFDQQDKADLATIRASS